MLELSKTKKQIIIKQNTGFWGIGFAIVMAVIGIRLVFELLPFNEGYTFADVFSFVFVCVWIIVVVYIGISGFTEDSKQITINSDGVLCTTWLSKKFMKWTDIKDWGLSYCGYSRGGNNYFLYFSEHDCQIKNDCKKKLKGNMIKICIIGMEYYISVRVIIPFCEEKTNITPFIGKDKSHFIW